jgi:hypothetical protein
MRYVPDISHIEQFFCLNFDTILIHLSMVYPRGYGRGWHGFVDEFVLIADMLWEED